MTVPANREFRAAEEQEPMFLAVCKQLHLQELEWLEVMACLGRHKEFQTCTCQTRGGLSGWG